uniref:Uncharacterized protein n=1 Tax=viral metagenome TaxID=1070528 RepID=A0A6C0CTK5_9ZZZZ
MTHKLLFLFGGIFFITLVLSYYKETYTNQDIIQILDISYVKAFLLKDTDHYVKNMSSADLYARHANNHKDYLKRISEDVTTIPLDKQSILMNSISQANDFFNNYSDSYIKLGEMNLIPWKLAFTKGYYENGLPHTRMDIIFLPQSILNESNYSITKTLIHEKVHLHQRKYKMRYQQKLQEENYKIIGKRINDYRIRSNPDVDEYIYYHPNNFIMIETYSTLTPKNIQDTQIVDIDVKYEHPYEEIAYQVAEKYSV